MASDQLSDQHVASNLTKLYAERPFLSAEDPTRRFVILLPSSNDDVPVCRLVLRDMFKCEYEALSYTWVLEDKIRPQGMEWDDSLSWEDIENSGSEASERKVAVKVIEALQETSNDKPQVISPSERPLIKVNDLDIPVMQNLYSALHKLRRSDRERCLWVDYLCINQQEISDKNAQVLNMDAIYSNATQVVIWLGLPDADTPTAFAELYRLTTDNHLTTLYDAKMLSKAQITTQIKPLVNLVSRGWFQRVWVVQEVALARQATVQIGGLSLPWVLFSEAARTIRKHMDCCVDIIHPLMDDRGGDYLLSMRSCFANILALDISNEKQNLSMHEALRLFYARLTTDSRDKVFALLGLLKQDSRLLEPDYSLSAADVYTEVAMRIIERTKDLSILVDTDELAGEVDVPSWVPDWTNVGLQGVNIYDFYGAAGKSETTITRCSQRSIHLKGTIFDFAAEVITDASPTEDSSELWEASSKLREWEQLVKEKFGFETEYFTGETYDRAFWHTVMMGVNSSRTARLADADYESWQAWRDWIDKFHDLPPHQREEAARAGSNDANIKLHNDILTEYPSTRWFFLTEDGYMGLGPFHMETRDLICVLAGGKMPFVLRAINESCETGGLEQYCYQFQGFAYVHGFMDGFAVQGLEEGTEEWRDFCLR
ncbi:hypothetical protein MMC10_003170 [Thelotrema lepadinum]|nr:hypothetical protein [Thelotrema lepadinum]